MKNANQNETILPSKTTPSVVDDVEAQREAIEQLSTGEGERESERLMRESAGKGKRMPKGTAKDKAAARAAAAKEKEDFGEAGKKKERAPAPAKKEEPAPASAPAGKELDVPVGKLVASDDNPRGASDFSKAALRELRESIEGLGLLHRPGVTVNSGTGSFTVVYGHRRIRACEQLGWESIPCTLVPNDDAGAATLAENEVRLDVDPLRTSDLVLSLLERPGWTPKRIAEASGKSLRWVHRRANLASLSKAVRREVKRGDSILAAWPADWLEEIALLSPDGQNVFIFGEAQPGKDAKCDWGAEGITNLRELRRVVGEQLRVLSLAPWDPGDAQLCKKAGACLGCQKHSGATATLFDEFEDKEKKKTERWLCRDTVCWDLKLETFRSKAVAGARERLGDQLVLVHGEHGGGAPISEVEGEKILWTSELKKCVKSDPDAIPILFVDGRDVGKTGWMKPKREGQKVAGLNGRTALTLAERRKRLEVRRNKATLERCAELVRKSKQADGKSRPQDLLAFFSSFGMAGVSDDFAARSKRRSLLEAEPVKRDARLWKKVKERVEEILTWSLRGQDKSLKDAILACPYCGVDAETVKLDVDETILEPKSWTKLAEQEKAAAKEVKEKDAAKAPAKKKAGKKGKGTSKPATKKPDAVDGKKSKGGVVTK